MASFDFLTAGRIRFGRGTASEAETAALSYGRRVLLVRGRSVGWVNGFSDRLSEAGGEVTSVICTREPDLSMLREALETARANAVEVVIAIGGGAVIDLGKAVAALAPGSNDPMVHLEGIGRAEPLADDPLPFVALPTTSGTGAEVTKNAVIAVPEAGRKVSLRDNRMLPDLAIVDPALTDDAPRAVTLSAGLDAIVQVIEPYLSAKANPLTDAIARAAIPRGLSALAVLADREDAAARDDMAFVSLCGGLALANAGLGAVHGLAGVIGGRLGAPHGLICGRLLGPVLEANAAACVADGGHDNRYREISEWIEASWDLKAAVAFSDLPAHLDQWSVSRLGDWLTDDVDLTEIAAEAAGSSSMRGNPVELSPEILVRIMQAAI